MREEYYDCLFIRNLFWFISLAVTHLKSYSSETVIHFFHNSCHSICYDRGFSRCAFIWSQIWKRYWFIRWSFPSQIFTVDDCVYETKSRNRIRAHLLPWGLNQDEIKPRNAKILLLVSELGYRSSTRKDIFVKFND